ncbi:MAG: hypothetical protein ACI97A_003654 [Planctomycetota bacterium]|jgi:hypothetical protein
MATADSYWILKTTSSNPLSSFYLVQEDGSVKEVQARAVLFADGHNGL